MSVKGARPETTKMLSLSVEHHLNSNHDPRVCWAKEVTFDYATANKVRVDYMLFSPKNNTVSGIEKGDFYCYEVKSSVDDFHSKNGHNLIGDYNYYVMPEEVYEAVGKEIPYHVGVYAPDGMGGKNNETVHSGDPFSSNVYRGDRHFRDLCRSKIQIQENLRIRKLQCGVLQRFLLLFLSYICPKCGHVMDRDKQAAINIDEEGMRILSMLSSGEPIKMRPAC